VSATPQLPPSYHGRPVLTTAEASAKSGLNREYISYLLETGRIEGTKPWGREWMIYEDSFLAYLAQPRSKGRKGPRKKREVRHTEQGDRVLLSTSEAHEHYGYAQNYLLELLRSGRIEGERSGRQWLIYEDSLLAYKRRKHPTTVESTLVESEEPSSSPSEPSPDE
jgi:excisionase family DNA binding protein